ncbi:M81 family metallopeptidase [Microvirga alba]|uniref:Microcystinase C n=1 Tax=Microvirga alba TaxID=2791025 RepID=A0A931BRD9_9HYPH|nr:M81 family metallopeptidase [Microvirga alba]MBF9235526.1 M81 family metallopeptidase [Microvirga alba]
MSFTVLTAEFSHESNTFSRRLTDYTAFTDRTLYFGEQAVTERGDANTPLAGFLDVARAFDWRTIHPISAAAQPAGPVTRDAYERIAGVIVEAARANRDRIDGILLGLHGAMVTDFCQDGEGELLERLRAVVSHHIPIGITLDPHANVTRKMCELANIVVSYKTYPHVDMRICGRQAGEVLQRAMAGEIAPVTVRVHRPMLEEVNGGRTDIGPMIERIARARAYEAEPDVFAVSVNGAFGNADIEEVGPTVLVTAQGDLERHRRFAESLADDIWNRRLECINSYVSVNDAALQGKSYKRKTGPLVIADYADNPGGGGYGDSTELLRAMIAAGVEDACFGPMVDPEVAAELHRHKVGETVSTRLGGKTDPRVGGAPLSVTGELMLLSNGHYVGDGPMAGGLKGSWGPTAVLRVGGIDILVVSIPTQMLDLQQFRTFGIDPVAKSVVALKSMQHFRAAFEPIAGDIIVCDSGALCTPDLSKLPFRNVPRPIFPLDRDMTLSL